MSSGKKADDKNDEIESELSEAFSGSEVKMSDMPEDDEEYSMTLNEAEDSLAISTSLKQTKNGGLGASLTSDKPKGNG